MTLHYTVRPARPDAHVFEVSLDIPGPIAEGEPLRFARWIPGSYLIREFAKSVLTIGDESGRPLEPTDVDAWALPARPDGMQVRLSVHAREASVRAAWLDRERGFFNGTSLFPYLPERAQAPVTMTLLRPPHTEGESWSVATSLSAQDVDADGFGVYAARDIDELFDHPVEMGALQRVPFQACGVPHEIVIAGGAVFDEQRLADDLARICEVQIRFFGEPAPMPYYVFLTALADSGYGGLEHRASTALMATRDALPMPASDEASAAPARSEAYVTFLGLCSHEYFHTWNVKRIKPARFTPYALQREMPTRLLWFFEGMTSYYDDLLLLRAGLIERDVYLDLLGRTVTRVQRGAGRQLQSVTASSLAAWTKFYRQDENAPNAIVSYYAKGALLALCLDAWMREASDGRLCLDDLMRDLWSRWRENGAGLAEDEPERRVAALVGDAVAERLSHALQATGNLPLEQAFRTLGIALDWRARRTGEDAGTAAMATRPAARTWLGASVASDPAGVRLVHVYNDGPAERAGLAPGDIVLAVGGFRVDKGSLDAWLERHAGADSVEVHAFQRGRLVPRSLPLQAPPTDTAVLVADDESRLARWLSADSAPTAPGT